MLHRALRPATSGAFGWADFLSPAGSDPDVDQDAWRLERLPAAVERPVVVDLGPLGTLTLISGLFAMASSVGGACTS